jgi:hypothetical protein
MQRKKCFGAMTETTYQDGVAFTQTRAACRDCQDFRDCLNSGKAKEEAKNQGEEHEKHHEIHQAPNPAKDHSKEHGKHQSKPEAQPLLPEHEKPQAQHEVIDDRGKDDLIAKIIDHSEVLSNEMGTCLLEFLNRMYSSPFGKALFKNLVLFYEIPHGVSSLTVTIPLSASILESIPRKDPNLDLTFDPDRIAELEAPSPNLTVRIILLHRRFENNRKANVGLIAQEVASMFSSNDYGTKQILEVLPEKEAKVFTKMDVNLRTNFLILKWGYREEHEAYRHVAGGLN